MKAVLQGCLIGAKQRFARNSAVAIDISYYLERLETRLETPNNLVPSLRKGQGTVPPKRLLVAPILG